VSTYAVSQPVVQGVPLVIFRGFAQNPIHPNTNPQVMTVVTEYQGAKFVSADKSAWAESEGKM